MWEKTAKNNTLVELPLSTRILFTSYFAIVDETTTASSWGVWTPRRSLSKKGITSLAVFALFGEGGGEPLLPSPVEIMWITPAVG